MKNNNLPYYDINEVKPHLPIETVVKHYTDKIDYKTNLPKTFCLFHDEKDSPSLTLYPDTNTYHCFGCGKTGDAINFISEMEGLDFADSLRFAVETFQLNVKPKSNKNYKPTPEQNKKSNMLKVFEEVQKLFVQNFNDPKTMVAKEYLSNRGFKDETLKTFGIGFCTNNVSQIMSIGKRNFVSNNDLCEAGLLFFHQKHNKHYCPYDNMITFPISDRNGKIIAYGARNFLPNTSPKYKNSTNGFLYTKSQNWYGLHQARQVATQQDSIFVVEGYLDVLSFHQEGIKNTVACLGTAVSKEQVLELSNFTKNITFLFDGDNAGKKASADAVDTTILAGLKPYVVNLPHTSDPDTFIKHLGYEETYNYLRKNVKEGLKLSYLTKLKSFGIMETMKWFHSLIKEASSPLFRTLLIRQIELICDIPAEVILAEYEVSSSGEIK